MIEVRKPDKNLTLKNQIINTFFIFLFGIALGIISKWLDNLAIDDTVGWQHILGILDLRNVFSSMEIWVFLGIIISIFSRTPLRASVNVLLFFVGMTVSYHLYTIFYCGFNPETYMMIWYTITIISPIFAYACWYARGKNFVANILKIGILLVMFSLCFSIGFWYIDLKSIIDFILFVGTILALCINPKTNINDM